MITKYSISTGLIAFDLSIAQGALSLGAVYRSVGFTAKDYAAIGLRIYKTKQGARKEVLQPAENLGCKRFKDTCVHLNSAPKSCGILIRHIEETSKA